MQRVHGTCVDLGGGAVLIRGRSGCGKSDLALRLMDQGAVLVADDQVCLSKQGVGLVADVPDGIAGLIEVRGLGIVRQPFHRAVPLVLVADLVPADQIDRLPASRMVTLLEVLLPMITLDPWAASAPAKIRLAVRCARDSLILPCDQIVSCDHRVPLHG